MFKLVVFLSTLFSVEKLANGDIKPRECSPRNTATSSSSAFDNSIYCVCNSTYCDDAPNVIQPYDKTEYTIISSSKSGQRFKVTTGNFGRNNSTARQRMTIDVNPEKIYQQIIGFGSSISDAAGININSLSEATREELLRSYFSDEGLEYTIIRVPMGASDFSTRTYSYAETKDDVLLKHFALANEDIVYKIPYLRRAMELNKRTIKLIASPWSGPPWMKDNNNWIGGCLKRRYWQLWANYFAKFFEEYKIRGLNFWALTPQNEPLVAFVPAPIASMGWLVQDQRDWIVKFLKPTLKESGFDDIDIIIGDGQRGLLPLWPKEIMRYEEGREAVSGTGVHWYFDALNPVSKLDQTHNLFPDKYIIYTESCAGPPLMPGGVHFGSWERAEKYAISIIETISHWVAGWVDWNMALDLNGGPNWVNNYVDSPVIVNKTADEFYKQPTFYVMGHFSKYVHPGSVRISTTNKGLFGIPSVAFKRQDNATVILILNTYSFERIIFISDKIKGTIPVSLPGKSIHTLIYW